MLRRMYLSPVLRSTIGHHSRRIPCRRRGGWRAASGAAGCPHPVRQIRILARLNARPSRAPRLRPKHEHPQQASFPGLPRRFPSRARSTMPVYRQSSSAFAAGSHSRGRPAPGPRWSERAACCRPSLPPGGSCSAATRHWSNRRRTCASPEKPGAPAARPCTGSRTEPRSASSPRQAAVRGNLAYGVQHMLHGAQAVRAKCSHRRTVVIHGEEQLFGHASLFRIHTAERTLRRHRWSGPSCPSRPQI